MGDKGCWYSQYYWIENEYTGEIHCIKKDSPDVEDFKEIREERIKEKIKQLQKQLQKEGENS